ncbi:hypothetical protein P9112_000837 [Eukaryota sp. TZLM1-RC]
MGVSGLLSYTNSHSRPHSFDFNERQSHKVHIAVDTSNIINSFLNSFFPDYLNLPFYANGVDAVSFYNYSDQLFSQIRARNIILHFFVEKKNQHDLKAKFDKKQHYWLDEKKEVVLNKGYTMADDPDSLHRIFNKAAHQSGHVLKFVPGEGDYYMANDVWNGTCSAVWSGDSDFVVFPRCKMILLDENFSRLLHNLKNNQEANHKVFSQHDVAQSLKLSDDDMILLAIMCGSDFVKKKLKPYMNMLSDKKYCIGRLEDIARQLKGPHHGARLRKKWEGILQNDPNLFKLVNTQKMFYRYQLLQDEDIFILKPTMEFSSLIKHHTMYLFKRKIILFNPNVMIGKEFIVSFFHKIIKGCYALYWRQLGHTEIAKTLCVGQLKPEEYDYRKKIKRFNCVENIPKWFSYNEPMGLTGRIQMAFTLLDHWRPKRSFITTPLSEVLFQQLADLYQHTPAFVMLAMVLRFLYHLTVFHSNLFSPTDLALFSFVCINGMKTPFKLTEQFDAGYESFVRFKVLITLMEHIYHLTNLLNLPECFQLHSMINYSLFSYLRMKIHSSNISGANPVGGLLEAFDENLIEWSLRSQLQNDQNVALLMRFLSNFYGIQDTCSFDNLKLEEIADWDNLNKYKVKGPSLEAFSSVEEDVQWDDRYDLKVELPSPEADRSVEEDVQSSVVDSLNVRINTIARPMNTQGISSVNSFDLLCEE